MKKRMFQKKDFVLAAVIAIIAGISALMVMFAQSGAGTSVRVTVDGALYGEYSLSGEQSIFIDSASGYNRLVIENGSVYMAEADCPDKYCMDYKPVSRGGETIICLPHRLVVEVTGTRDAHQPDVVVQ
ncbi:MAG: NusG domain II-containing protein [Lachnospiraceae bacterium]